MNVLCYSYWTRGPQENEKVVRNSIERAHRYNNILIEIERERRAANIEAGDDEDARAKIKEKFDARIRDERARCGVYWGTYLLVEDAVQQAVRSKQEPKFRRWEGTGRIGVQLQGGLTVAELLEGKDTRARLSLNPDATGYTLQVRVGSDGRKPVWASFDLLTMARPGDRGRRSRPLPPTATVKWIRIHLARVGVDEEWSAQFVVDDVEAVLPSPSRKKIALNVGWRRVDDGIRVAAWVDDQGQTGELRLSQEILDRWQKVQDLESIRDTRFNDAIKFIAEADKTNWPDWMVEATKTARLWRSQNRLVPLVLKWRGEVEGQKLKRPQALEHLEAWRRQDKHLLTWAAHQRVSTLRQRTDIYRTFARQVAAQYKEVLIGKVDLRDFAERPEKPSEEDPRTRASRGRRFMAGLSDLLGCISYAARRAGSTVVEIDSAWMTKTCAKCHERDDFDAGSALVHDCTHCGARWDQDFNAAENMLAADPAKAKASTRRAPKVVDESGKTKADLRREKALATRRGKAAKKKAS